MEQVGEWFVVLRTAQPVPPGQYEVTCVMQDREARFGVGPYKSTVGSVFGVLGAIGIAGFGFVIAGIVALVTFVRRKSARRNQQQPWPGRMGA